MTDKPCICEVKEDPEELGYTYLMCTEHYDKLMEYLDRPPRVIPELARLLKSRGYYSDES